MNLNRNFTLFYVEMKKKPYIYFKDEDFEELAHEHALMYKALHEKR